MKKLIFLIFFTFNYAGAMEQYRKMKEDFWKPENLAKNKDIELDKLKGQLEIGIGSRVMLVFVGHDQYLRKNSNRSRAVYQALEIKEKKQD